MPGKPSSDYRVRLDVFEGPLDLLLYLVRQQEVDVWDIPVAVIADQYEAFLNEARNLNLDVAGEFVVMAATLTLLKSRLLLPRDETAETDEEEDPRWDLVRQLVEYKKFKDAAMQLDRLQVEREDVFARDEAPEAVLGRNDGKALQDVGLYELIRAFEDAMKKAERLGHVEVRQRRWTVAEKSKDLRGRLMRMPRFSLLGLLDAMTSREEVACTFLALLELIRLHVARAVQMDTFGEIEVIRGDGRPDPEPEDAQGAPPEEDALPDWSTEGLPPDAKRKAERLLAKARAKKTAAEQALLEIDALTGAPPPEGGDA